MDSQELKSKSSAELQALLSLEQEKLRDLRYKDSNKQLKNVREIRNVKKLIARVFTQLKVSSLKK